MRQLALMSSDDAPACILRNAYELCACACQQTWAVAREQLQSLPTFVARQHTVAQETGRPLHDAHAQYHHTQRGAKKGLGATALAGVPQQRVAVPDWDSCAQKSRMAAPCIEHSITSPAPECC
jgi:hypothetical protein